MSQVTNDLPLLQISDLENKFATWEWDAASEREARHVYGGTSFSG